jgi:anti-anti-sigma factor
MEIKTKVRDTEQAVVSPAGGIDFSNSQFLKAELFSLLEAGYRKIIIDFSQVNNIDSSGLGRLLLFQKRVQEKNGVLVIKNVKDKSIQAMFKMIHLDKVIQIKN